MLSSNSPFITQETESFPDVYGTSGKDLMQIQSELEILLLICLRSNVLRAMRFPVAVLI